MKAIFAVVMGLALAAFLLSRRPQEPESSAPAPEPVQPAVSPTEASPPPTIVISQSETGKLTDRWKTTPPPAGPPGTNLADRWNSTPIPAGAPGTNLADRWTITPTPSGPPGTNLADWGKAT